MGRFRQFMILTLVQVCLVGGAWGASSTAKATKKTAPATAQQKSASSDTIPDLTNVSDVKPEVYFSVICEKKMKDSPEKYRSKNECIQEENGKSGEPCKEANSAYLKSNADFSDACAQSGLGGSCSEAIKDCFENEGAKEQTNLSAMMGQFGLPSLEQAGANEKACPTMTYEKWDSKHTKIEDKLTKSKDSLVEAKEKVAKAQKQYNETNVKLSEKYNNLNKEEAKRKLEENDAKRKATVQVQENTRKLQEAVFNNSMALQDLKQQVVSLNIEKAAKLAEGSAAIAKFKCTSDLQDKLKKMGTSSSSAFSNMMSSGSSSRNSSQAIYNACITAFLAAREQQIHQYDSKLESINSKITNTEEMQKSLQDSLKTTKDQSNEVMADLAKAGEDGDKAYQQEILKIQTEMKNNYNESVQSLQTLNENQSRLEQDVNRASNQFLSSQNKQPEDGSESTYKKANGKYEDLWAKGQAAASSCSCKEGAIARDARFCKNGSPVSPPRLSPQDGTP